MIRTVAQALDDAAAGPGAYVFVDANGAEGSVRFAALRDSALALGGALRARGLEPGDCVALVIPEAAGFLTAFLGASVAGLVPTPLADPVHAGTFGAYLDMIAPLVRAARARAIITTPRLRPLLDALQVSAPTIRFVSAWSELTGPALAAAEPADADAPALFQFTSGSTSQPKGVVLTHANLAANIHAIGGPAGLGLSRDCVGVSWLPLFHDMGLIGLALCALYHGNITVLLSPWAFVKRPVAWLRAITRHHGTISFAPNFAYEMCVRRVKDAELDGLDLSSWRVAGCGAEPIQAGTLEAFAAKFAPVGFRATSFVPAYGLAEHTLAATLAPPGRDLRVDTVRASELAARRRAVPCSSDAPGALRLVGCGRAFPEHALRVVDDRGHPVGERVVGEILVSGPSVMQGYLSAPGATAEVIRDGWCSTGDLGYLAGGELYICGRRKETIIVAGRNYFPQDLEQVVNRVPGVRAGCVAAFAATEPGHPDRAVVVVETQGHTPGDLLQAEVRRRLLQATGLAVHEIVLVPKGTVGRTTSGKLRRVELRERYAAGTLVRTHPRARSPQEVS
jgi:acyl-CoA synthetase (AMP-forming)/AMP-acid ligase II